MQTPSNSNVQDSPRQPGRWKPLEDRPRRSVFGNFVGNDPAAASGSEQTPPSTSARDAARLRDKREIALARAFLYRFLACAYEDPAAESWEWLCDPSTAASAEAAWRVASGSAGVRLGLDASAPPVFRTQDLVRFRMACSAVFGHAARGSCPLNEIEYGDLNADPLFQPHRLSDLAAFYRAFGLEVAPDAGERLDHISFELEFMCVLAAKEACGLEPNQDVRLAEVCRDAERKFLRDHPGRWLPAFSRRLASATEEPLLRQLAKFTGAFILSECARFAVGAGAEDLLLRPVDEAAETLCGSCGLSHLPPGALRTS